MMTKVILIVVAVVLGSVVLIFAAEGFGFWLDRRSDEPRFQEVTPAPTYERPQTPWGPTPTLWITPQSDGPHVHPPQPRPASDSRAPGGSASRTKSNSSTALVADRPSAASSPPSTISEPAALLRRQRLLIEAEGVQNRVESRLYPPNLESLRPSRDAK